jgi:copper transporter 1
MDHSHMDHGHMDHGHMGHGPMPDAPGHQCNMNVRLSPSGEKMAHC